MSKFDGSPDDLTYGQALVEIAGAIGWGSEDRKREVVRAIQTEHNIVPPDPDVIAIHDPRDAELVALRDQVAQLAAAKAAIDKAAELEKLRAQVAELSPQDPTRVPDTGSVSESAAGAAKPTPATKA